MMNLFTISSCFGTRWCRGRAKRRIPHPRPARVGVPVCSALLSRASPSSGRTRRLLLSKRKGSFRIRSKTEGRKKKKNPTHFSELLSQFSFIPVMLVKCASLAARPETAFQPHFFRADAGGALLPSGARSPTPGPHNFPRVPLSPLALPPLPAAALGRRRRRRGCAGGRRFVHPPAAADEPICGRSPALPPPSPDAARALPSQPPVPGAVLPARILLPLYPGGA